MLDESYIESEGDSHQVNGQPEGRAGSRNDAVPSPSTFSTPTKSAHSSQSSSPQKYKGIVAKEISKNGKTWTRLEDPNAPKKPRSAYVHFLSSARAKYGKARIGSANDQQTINRALAGEWQQLSEADKQKYQSIAQKEKGEYKKAMDVYMKTPEYKMFVAQRDKILKQEGRKPKRSGKGAAAAAVPSGGSQTNKWKRKTHVIAPDELCYSAPVMAQGNVPIFSQEFLDFNREREAILRNVRKSIGDVENEQQAAKRTIAKIHSNIDSINARIQQDSKTIEDCETHLTQWMTTVLKSFEKCNASALSSLPSDMSPESIAAFLIALSSGRPSPLLEAAKQAASSLK
ncbi:hypothetical protein WR25_18200 [Diploscapter pachys]|uniref:HMG box domain-containing protein n=1 Tax=Diploscapter pachys TaxID=2018661 RepID=A0A2A2JIE9_9BILA|nr:hypothetical protein WR25_18200 [Diploscapter pachys]